MFLRGKVLCILYLTCLPLFLYAQLEDSCEALFERHGFLEEGEGERAREWIQHQNARTLLALKIDPRFGEIKNSILKIQDSPDKLLYGSHEGKYVYNFLRDGGHPRGLLRRTTAKKYYANAPEWEAVLDIDALVAQEGTSWVYHGYRRLPKTHHVLIFLSPGGGDAFEVREFDFKAKAFVKDGFYLPVSKTEVAWVDKNTLIVGTDFGLGSLTDSGYNRILKLWKRGTSLEAAKTVFEGQKTDVFVSVMVLRFKGQRRILFTRLLDFFRDESFIYDEASGDLKFLDLPGDAKGTVGLNGNFCMILKRNWRYQDVLYRAGDLLEVNLSAYLAGKSAIRLVYHPPNKMPIVSVSKTKSALFVKILENVSGKIIQLTPTEKGWEQNVLPLPENGDPWITDIDPDGNFLIVGYEDFLTPDTLYFYDLKTRALKPFKALPPQFDASRYQVQQLWATSVDGTRIPYFVIASKDMKLDGSNPVILNAYGGFEVNELPAYMPTLEKIWLSRGGVYVVANIRGGGEFGADWHRSGIQENRQRVYDDFISVAEDLIGRGITSERKLGITGGSNGGLLMGVAVTQRPDLFQAAYIDVPLLDMLRYHLLLAGASWMAEYGNPEDPRMREILLSYSPYHNIRATAAYPEVLIVTANDDRVHPAHARKFEQGHPFYFLENNDGGHGGGATVDSSADERALMYIYFMQKLMQKE